MNINLTPEMESMVNKRVATGRYHDPSEVVQEALRLMEHVDQERQLKLEKLRVEIRIGTEQLNRGEYADYSLSGMIAELDAEQDSIE